MYEQKTADKFYTYHIHHIFNIILIVFIVIKMKSMQAAMYSISCTTVYIQRSSQFHTTVFVVKFLTKKTSIRVIRCLQSDIITTSRQVAHFMLNIAISTLFVKLI